MAEALRYQFLEWWQSRSMEWVSLSVDRRYYATVDQSSMASFDGQMVMAFSLILCMAGFDRVYSGLYSPCMNCATVVDDEKYKGLAYSPPKPILLGQGGFCLCAWSRVYSGVNHI